MRLLLSGPWILAAAALAFGQTYNIQTAAGGILPENVVGISANLGSIGGVATDAAGNVFMLLSDHNIVVRIDAATGVLTGVAGNGTFGQNGDGGPAINAQLGPLAIAVSPSGDLYIGELFDVRKVSGGIVSTVATLDFLDRPFLCKPWPWTGLETSIMRTTGGSTKYRTA